MKKLQQIFEKLAKKIEEIRALCPDILDLYVPDAEKVLCEVKKVLDILADPNGAMNPATVGFVGATAEVMYENLSKFERKYLTSISTGIALRTRMYENIQNEVYIGRMTQIEHAFGAWDSLRGVGTTNELRTAYNKLTSVIESAEEASVAYRIREASRQKLERKETIRRQKVTNVGPTTAKGPAGQKSDKNGGFGTSRKSVQKRRRRKPKAGQTKQQAA